MRLLRVLLITVFALSSIGLAQAKVLVDMSSDFKNWRDESSNPGFNAEFKMSKEKKYGIISLAPDHKFGKVMSPEEGVTVNIDENTKIFIKLKEDIEDGSVTVNLMTAAEPYDAHKIIGSVDKKGVYFAKIAEKTPWSGKHSFWVEVWLGGENNPKARLSGLKITDGKKTVKKKMRKVKKRSAVKKSK